MTQRSACRRNLRASSYPRRLVVADDHRLRECAGMSPEDCSSEAEDIGFDCGAIATEIAQSGAIQIAQFLV